jgi:predicted NBD/HSP70 family sugar kinase
MEHIAVGLVEGAKVVGALNIYPQKSQTLDPLQSMPAESIVECVRQQVEKVANGAEIAAIGIGFPGVIRAGVVEDSPNLQQVKGFALQAALSSALGGKAAGVPVRVFNDADVMAAGIAATQGKLHQLTRVWTLGPQGKLLWMRRTRASGRHPRAPLHAHALPGPGARRSVRKRSHR